MKLYRLGGGITGDVREQEIENFAPLVILVRPFAAPPVLAGHAACRAGDARLPTVL